MAENFPVEKVPQGEEPNPFMGNNIEKNPFKINPEDNPFRGPERPTSAKEPEKKEEKKEKEPPLKFKGSFGGGVVKAKLFSFLLGKKEGYKDFKAFGVNKDVREEMEELRKRFASAGGNFVRKDRMQIEANRLRREMPHMQGDKHTAAVKFLKELEDKTGIKPR